MCGKSLGLLEERIGSCTGFSSYFKQNVEKHISAAVSRSPACLLALSFIRLLRSFGSLSSVQFGSLRSLRVVVTVVFFGFVRLAGFVRFCLIFCSASLRGLW